MFFCCDIGVVIHNWRSHC